MTTYEICYQVFTGREGRISSKCRSFKTKLVLVKFISKLVESNNFYKILAYGEVEQ